MKKKAEILSELSEYVDSGVISSEDLRKLADDTERRSDTSVSAATERADDTATTKAIGVSLSVVDVMLYVAGVVFYAAIMSFIAQSWDSSNIVINSILSTGIGLVLWIVVVLYLEKTRQVSELVRSLSGTLLLTGSLLIISGGFIITNELMDGYGEHSLYAYAVTFLLLGAIHTGFDRLVKKDLVVLMGILLIIAAFASAVFGVLANTNISYDLVALVLITSFGLTALAARIAARVYPDRSHLHKVFDPFVILLTLVVAYFGGFTEHALAWQIALILAVITVFYLSILTRTKQLLGTASVFLVLTILTLTFKYFSGMGITVSLVIATIGVLGTAAAANHLNKQYFA